MLQNVVIGVIDRLYRLHVSWSEHMSHLSAISCSAMSWLNKTYPCTKRPTYDLMKEHEAKSRARSRARQSLLT